NLGAQRSRSFIVEPPLIHMAYDADDLRVWDFVRISRIGGEVQVLTDGIAVRKILLCEAFVDDDDGGGVFIVRGVEKASAFQGDLHYFQVVWLYDVFNCHSEVALVRRHRFINEPEILFIIATHGMSALT